MLQSKSPAVIAPEQEQAGQRRKDALEGELKATFPASDPVSETIASTTGSDVLGPSGNREAAEEEPLVDIALARVRDRSDAVAASVLPDEELAALQAEVSKLKESVAEIGSGSIRVLRARSEDVVEDARARIRVRPLQTVAYAMLAGFVLGIVR